LATTLASPTGETKTEAVTRALRDRLARVRRERSGQGLADELDGTGAVRALLECEHVEKIFRGGRAPLSRRALARTTSRSTHRAPSRNSVPSESLW
jgi:hypothetical protein